MIATLKSNQPELDNQPVRVWTFNRDEALVSFENHPALMFWFPRVAIQILDPTPKPHLTKSA